jgi:beta-glucuronidase
VYSLFNIGIRTIEVTSTSFLINGNPFYFHGVDKHEGTSPIIIITNILDSDLRGKGLDNVIVVKDFNLLEWLGANAFRTSHYPYADEFYFEADRRGIVRLIFNVKLLSRKLFKELCDRIPNTIIHTFVTNITQVIVDECPAVGLAEAEFFSNETLQHHFDVMYEMIRRDKNHPSVVMWNVANEPASNLAPAKPYFQAVANYTKTIDPTKRPVTLVQDQDFTSETCAEFFDVVCVNRYYGWYSDSGDLDLINMQLSYDLDGWYSKYNKPIIVSEYGADTVQGLHSDPSFMVSYLNYSY